MSRMTEWIREYLDECERLDPEGLRPSKKEGRQAFDWHADKWRPDEAAIVDSMPADEPCR